MQSFVYLSKILLSFTLNLENNIQLFQKKDVRSLPMSTCSRYGIFLSLNGVPDL